jgi:hypothetical protein
VAVDCTRPNRITLWRDRPDGDDVAKTKTSESVVGASVVATPCQHLQWPRQAKSAKDSFTAVSSGARTTA